MSRPSTIYKLICAGVLVSMLIFPHVRVAHAGSISFGGETEDNFWNITVTDCQDGFTVKAVVTRPAIAPIEIGNTFSVRVAQSSIPVTAALPVRIAGGVVPAVVSGTVTLFFAAPQAVGTSVSVTIERLDHG